MSNPHDQLFKAIFSDAVEVVRLLDLDAIEAQPSDFIDEALRAHLSDLGFRIPWRQGGHVHLGLLLEHQSSPDPEMPLRVLRYTLRAWEAAQAEPRPPGRLPLVITLVVFHGPRPWSTPRALSELYDAPPQAIEHLRPYLPELKLLLEDLTVTDDAEVPCDDGGKLALLLLRHAHMNDVWDTVDEHRGLLQALMRRRGPLPTLQILRYVMNVSERAPSEALKRRLFKDLPGDVKEEVMTYADMLREEGKQIGLRLTEEKAHDVAVDALTRLLQTRFGPLPTWALARLNTLDQNTLLELVPHAVSAPSLEALLTPDQPTRS
jgi:predicted transposase YdaD